MILLQNRIMLYIRHYSERIITHIISTGQDKMRSEVKVKVMGGAKILFRTSQDN